MTIGLLYNQQGRCTGPIVREWRLYCCAVVHPSWIPDCAGLSDWEGRKGLLLLSVGSGASHPSSLWPNSGLVSTGMQLDFNKAFVQYFTPLPFNSVLFPSRNSLWTVCTNGKMDDWTSSFFWKTIQDSNDCCSVWKLLARHYFQPLQQPYSTFMWYILSCAFVDGANEAGTECKRLCKGDMAEGMKPRLRPGESDLNFSLLIVQN